MPAFPFPNSIFSVFLYLTWFQEEVPAKYWDLLQKKMDMYSDAQKYWDSTGLWMKGGDFLNSYCEIDAQKLNQGT